MSFRALFLTSAPQNKAFRLVQAGYKSPLTISTLKCGMIFFFNPQNIPKLFKKNAYAQSTIAGVCRCYLTAKYVRARVRLPPKLGFFQLILPARCWFTGA